LGSVTVMVIRVSASALRQDQHSAANQQSKKSEVAWRNSKRKQFFLQGRTGKITPRSPAALAQQSFAQLCAAGNNR
jgi:hypothetical protein